MIEIEDEKRSEPQQETLYERWLREEGYHTWETELEIQRHRALFWGKKVENEE